MKNNNNKKLGDLCLRSKTGMNPLKRNNLDGRGLQKKIKCVRAAHILYKNI